VVQVSELEGHEGDVTALSVVPPPPGNAEAAVAKLATNCWTAGLDGELIYWDFATAEPVRKVHVGLPVHSMVSRSLVHRLMPSLSRLTGLMSSRACVWVLLTAGDSQHNQNREINRGVHSLRVCLRGGYE
jgi:hypothetical protein